MCARSPRKLIARLRDERAFTLVETMMAMIVLGIIMTPLVASFTSGVRHNIDQARRETAYHNARLALDRLRVDLHCASGVTSVEQNAYGGFTLTLTEANDQSGKGWCPNVIPAGSTSSGVQWCTIPWTDPNTMAVSTTRFVLYRFLGLDPTDCNGGAGSTFQTDYLAATPGVWPANAAAPGPPASWVGNLWPTAAPCPAGNLPSVAVNFNVAVDPVNFPQEHYQLIDEIALRNAPRCT